MRPMTVLFLELPLEIQHCIIMWCRIADIIKLAQTCRDFRDLIENNSKLLKLKEVSHLHCFLTFKGVNHPQLSFPGVCESTGMVDYGEIPAIYAVGEKPLGIMKNNSKGFLQITLKDKKSREWVEEFQRKVSHAFYPTTLINSVDGWNKNRTFLFEIKRR